jgi:hypothetical protein
MNGRDAPPLRRLAATTFVAFVGAILGAIAFAVLFGTRQGGEGVVVGAMVGAVCGAACALLLLAAGAVLRFAFGEDPSLWRQTLLGAVVAGACGAASQGRTGLAVGVTYGVVMAAVGAAILSLILRWKVIRDARGQPSSPPTSVGRQVFRGSAVAWAIFLAAVGLAVAATLLTLLFVVTPLKTVGTTVITASLLGSLVEPSIVVTYVILMGKASRKAPTAVQWDD